MLPGLTSPVMCWMHRDISDIMIKKKIIILSNNVENDKENACACHQAKLQSAKKSQVQNLLMIDLYLIDEYNQKQI